MCICFASNEIKYETHAGAERILARRDQSIVFHLYVLRVARIARKESGNEVEIKETISNKDGVCRGCIERDHRLHYAPTRAPGYRIPDKIGKKNLWAKRISKSHRSSKRSSYLCVCVCECCNNRSKRIANGHFNMRENFGNCCLIVSYGHHPAMCANNRNRMNAMASNRMQTVGQTMWIKCLRYRANAPK